MIRKEKKVYVLNRVITFDINGYRPTIYNQTIMFEFLWIIPIPIYTRKVLGLGCQRFTKKEIKTAIRFAELDILELQIKDSLISKRGILELIYDIL